MSGDTRFPASKISDGHLDPTVSGDSVAAPQSKMSIMSPDFKSFAVLEVFVV